MGKLSFRLILFLCCIQFAFSQDTLCVYKVKGTAILKINNAQTTLKKGALIPQKSLVNVLPQTEITAIDNNGNTYLVNVEGTYNLKHILNFKAKQIKSNFTASYFKHVWQDLRNKDTKKTLIAGVFRGETLMSFPPDSSKIASSKISFNWITDSTKILYYIFIKNSITDDVLKIETNGSQIALYDDNPIFYDSDTFQWTVSTEAFPNLDNIPFYSFTLIDRNAYETLKEDYSSFIKDLENLGHSEKEIESILCETYGLCK